MLSREFFYRLEDTLNLARAEINEKHMTISDLREAFRDIPGGSNLTLGYKNGNQIITVGDRTVEVGPMASNEDIRAALQNPFIGNSMSISGLAPGILQAKLAELRQRGQERLAQGVAKIDAAHSTGLSKIDAAADEAAKKIDAEIDSALHEFAQSTNGGPV